MEVSNTWLPSTGSVVFIVGPDMAHTPQKEVGVKKVAECCIYVNLMPVKMSNTMKLIVGVDIFWVRILNL